MPTTGKQTVFPAGDRKVVAAALRSPKGALTVLVVNETAEAVDARISVEGLAAKTIFYRYAITESESDRADVALEPTRKLKLDRRRTTFTDQLPRFSVTVYSAYRLGPESAGITVER